MARTKTKAENELDRTEILRYLKECGLQAVTPKSILVYMDDCLRAITNEGLDFHLRYMKDRGWVDIGIEVVLGKPEIIRWARIKADGVDEFDRRAAQFGEAGGRVA